MIWSEFSQVPDIAVDDKPAVFRCIVLGDLLDGEEFWGSHDCDNDKEKIDNGSKVPPTTGLLVEAGGFP